MDDYLDGSMDSEDVFPCKGCGEILEEGKAFELAGNRWHLDCFRCNTCNTLLDSDANLLLLGDGSLICNNCTYSCSACGNKIEDLAILTGDQAFCATCFRCRNCKRKIENLRYARTSQGIFCMSCHESLMARRRKKSKAAAQAKAREKDGSPMIKDKSLPALPPNAIPPNAFSNDRVTPESDTPTELSPRPPLSRLRNGSPSRNGVRPPPRSPERGGERSAESVLSPPAPNYRNNRNSSILSGDLTTGDAEGFYIPVALDPSPVVSPAPKSASESLADATRKSKDNKDYFSLSKPPEKRTDSQTSTPHIAFQEKSRQTSSDYESPQSERPSRKLSKRDGKHRVSSVAGDDHKTSSRKTPSPKEEFKLQDAPKSKKQGGSKTPPQSQTTAHIGDAAESSSKSTMAKQDSDRSSTPQTSQDPRLKDENEVRPSLDSLASSRSDAQAWKAISRKELPAPASRNADGSRSSGQGTKSATTDDQRGTAGLAASRPSPPEQKLSDTYMQPRAPPQPPSQGSKEPTGAKAEQSSPKASPKLPRWSAGGDFSLDEDMARILGTDEGSSSILRRVSNAVRHGRTNSAESSNHHVRIGHSRSVSETTRATASPRWPKTPIAEDPSQGGHHIHDISSPISLSGGAQDDPAFLKRQLRSSEQRVAELERQFTTEKDLKNLNKKLVEKRKTVSVLDTQTEIMIRQLEVLAGYVERAKETKQPVDPRDLEESAIKEFVQKLEKVRQNMAASIEQLIAERDELVEEKNQAIADRDRALLEFEQLSARNAQLADLNNDLTHQIQERFKSHIGSELKSPNGLGIYGHAKGIPSTSGTLDTTSLQTASTLVGTDAEEPVVEGPTVVNIRKGQVRKFNWKKGSSKVAQNISKGINRAAVAFQQQEQQQPRMYSGLTGDNIGLPYNMTVTQVDSPVSHVTHGANGQNRVASEGAAKGFGFFGSKKPVKSASTANVTTPTPPEAPTTLFGSDLIERAEYERRHIPSVVTRCIEEVELRGMDIEGIYRKTGGNSQVKMIQEGFDKTEDFDISDPSIDITAVTSVLKQYFRKLPVPLLTFDVYERVLESNGIQNETERCNHLRKTVNMLPQRHRDCLEFLMFHLARVASRERENLMSPKNLAVVFAPTIMRDHSLEKEMTDMHAKNIAVQFLIENSHTIFSSED
ncbi:hypothetical protein VTK73DRAFT_10404 [Phialemonium thermophilum]|uniref:Uncharacterized protein n=1 Tax=Phialemonium thermophilum TaxID=223376 RepID=A0ABR3XH36_9PEZI